MNKYYPGKPVNVNIQSRINIIQESNWVITTKKGKGKSQLFFGNVERVIFIYAGPGGGSLPSILRVTQERSGAKTKSLVLLIVLPRPETVPWEVSYYNFFTFYCIWLTVAMLPFNVLYTSSIIFYFTVSCILRVATSNLGARCLNKRFTKIDLTSGFR